MAPFLRKIQSLAHVDLIDVEIARDLSPGDATYGPALPDYNAYIGRLQRLLQGGRHVADIGVLYPIATLLPGPVFHLGLARYAPARMLIDAGAAVALA